MTQSPEYPDLKWVEPKSWTNANRSSVQLVVIHTTEGSAQGESAEDGAAYDARRTDGTSTHYFHDSNSTVQCVRTNDQAHTARAQGNRRGIHHELCGKAGTQNWASAYSVAMLQRAAKQAARDAKKWGIPVRHLTVAQVADGAKGFCGHWDITRAFPQDGGTHTDPGPNFPWSQFLEMVRTELAGKTTTLEDDMADLTKDNLAAIGKAAADAVWARTLSSSSTAKRWPETPAQSAANYLMLGAIYGKDATNASAADQARDNELLAAVQANSVDPQAIADAVVNLLPAEQVQVLLDALAARLAA